MINNVLIGISLSILCFAFTIDLINGISKKEFRFLSIKLKTKIINKERDKNKYIAIVLFYSVFILSFLYGIGIVLKNF